MTGTTFLNPVTILGHDASGKPEAIKSIDGALPSAGAEYDDAGDIVNPDRYAKTLTYSGGLVQTTAFTDTVNTWTKTFTYTGSDVTGISLWVKS